MSSKKISLLLSVALGCIAVPSFAEMVVVEKDQMVRLASETPKGKLVQTGVGKSMVVKGFANDIPLLVALKQVVPEGWHARKIGEVDLNRMVSWKGGKPWVDILAEMAMKNVLMIEVDWKQREISLSSPRNNQPFFDVVVPSVREDSSSNESAIPQPNSPPPSLAFQNQDAGMEANETIKSTAVFTLNAPGKAEEEKSEGFALGASAIKEESSAVKEVDSLEKPVAEVSGLVIIDPMRALPEVKKEMWTLVKGKTLKENMQAWATKAGWVLSWGGADYPVIATAEFKGDFLDQDGPVAAIMKAYENAEHPLIAKAMLKNKVLRIENKEYSVRQTENAKKEVNKMGNIQNDIH